ncbi:hypothetical protein LCGC14_0400430 [marine sediment metagenome]|uniref:Uncharacterized protein n=1 Tax=marine sediment metagenome TaxID=412755 RepID=A0A0F9W621_9ZZZZ
MEKIKKVNWGLIAVVSICLLIWVGVIYATTFSFTYDIVTPAGSDSPAEADDRMREIKAAVQERMNVCMYWPLTGTEVSDADAGEFRFCLFHAPIAATPTVAADHGHIRVKDVGSKAEFTWTDEDENELVLTSKGNNLANNTYLTATDNAGTGSVNLIKANTSDSATLPDGAVLDAATQTADGDRTIVDLNYAKTGDTVQHDSEGGFSNVDVDSVKTKVYTKYLTGTLDADSSTSVVHGITGIDNIFSVTVLVFEDTTFTSYLVSEAFQGTSSTSVTVVVDATNVVIRNVGSLIQGNKFRVKIDYIL